MWCSRVCGGGGRRQGGMEWFVLEVILKGQVESNDQDGVEK